MTDSARGSARNPELVELSSELAEDVAAYYKAGGKRPKCAKHKTYTVAEIKEQGLIDVSKIMKQKKRPGM